MQQSGSYVPYLYCILSFLGEGGVGGGGGNDLKWIKDDGFPSRKVLWYAWSIFIHVDSCFELDI